VNDLLLDPNNPRLFEERESRVPDDQIARESVQESTLELMKQERFGVKQLKNSVLQVGFLPIDKIVVRRLDEKFVVVEGNRRIAALKWITKSIEAGEFQPSEDLSRTRSSREVYELQTDAESYEKDRWLIQGVRHISGIKEWGLYEKALSVRSLVEDLGLSPREAAEARGTGTQEGNRLYRALGAFHQMQENDDFGERAETDLFSYFVEALGKPALRTFLGWDEASRSFANEENRMKFYSWIVPGGEGMRKLPMAIDTRRLATVIGSDRAFRVFDSEGGSLDAALAALEILELYDWREPVRDAIAALNNIPARDLEVRREEDLNLLQEIIDLATRRKLQFGATPPG